MEKCLQCFESLVHVPGRKQKSFCDVNCRNKYFYAQRKKQLEEAKALLVSLPPDYVEIKKIDALTKDDEVKPLTLSKTLKRDKKPEKLQSRVDYVDSAKEAYDAPRIDTDKIQDEPMPEWKKQLLQLRQNKNNTK